MALIKCPDCGNEFSDILVLHPDGALASATGKEQENGQNQFKRPGLADEGICGNGLDLA